MSRVARYYISRYIVGNLARQPRWDGAMVWLVEVVADMEFDGEGSSICKLFATPVFSF